MVSKKKTKSVPSAVEPKPGSANLPEAVSSAPAPGRAPLPIDLSGLSLDKIDLAKKMGIPLDQILNWMQSVEQRFSIIETTLPKQIVDQLEARVKAAAQPPQAFPQAQPQAQGALGGIGISDILRLIGSGGGATSTDDWLRDVGRETIGLSNEVFRAMVKEMVPQAMENWEKRRAALTGK